MNLKVMEKRSSSENCAAKQEMLSCCERFMQMILLKKNHKKLENNDKTLCFVKSKRSTQPSTASFRYSPKSYSQNFDAGDEWENKNNQGSSSYSFSSRYAAPYSSNSDN